MHKIEQQGEQAETASKVGKRNCISIASDFTETVDNIDNLEASNKATFESFGLANDESENLDSTYMQFETPSESGELHPGTIEEIVKL